MALDDWSVVSETPSTSTAPTATGWEVVSETPVKTAPQPAPQAPQPAPQAPQLAPQAQKTSTLPVTQETREKIFAAWDNARPAQRILLESQPGYIGYLAKERAGMFPREPKTDKIAALTTEAAPKYTPASPTTKLDTRREARRANLERKGVDPQTANYLTNEAIRRGIAPGSELEALVPGKVEQTDVDFDTANLYKQRGLNNPLARGVSKGVIGLGKASIGVNQAIAEAIGADDAAADMKKYATKARGMEEGIGQRGTFLERNLEGAIASLSQQLPIMLGSVYSGSAGLSLAGMGVNSFGQEYSDGRAKGLDPLRATTRASLYAALDILGERFGLKGNLSAIKKAADGMGEDAAKEFLANTIKKEIPGELLTTTGQFITDKAPEIGLRPNATFSDYLGAVADTVAQTVMQGGIQSSGGLAVGKGVEYVQNKGFSNRLAATEAESAKDKALAAWENTFAPLRQKPAAPKAEPAEPAINWEVVGSSPSSERTETSGVNFDALLAGQTPEPKIDFDAVLAGTEQGPTVGEEVEPPPKPVRDIEAEAKRLNKMGIPMSDARRIAESVDRTPENQLPPVDTWPDAAVRGTLEFQLNKPEEERNEELVNLLQAEVAKRGPVSGVQKRIADIADEFIASGVPPLEARTRAEQQVKDEDEADALAAAEAAKGEQPLGFKSTPRSFPVVQSAEGLQTLLTNIANEYVTYAKLSPEEALERARGFIRDKYGADALAAAEAAKGEQRDTGTVTPPSGEGAGVASVPDTGTAAEGLAETTPAGLVPTATTAEQPAGREEAKPGAVEEAPAEAPFTFFKSLLGADGNVTSYKPTKDEPWRFTKQAVGQIVTFKDSGTGKTYTGTITEIEQLRLPGTRGTTELLKITDNDPASAQDNDGNPVPEQWTLGNDEILDVKEAPAEPKKRGRPALTEEQKAAKAAAQQPAGKRGRKPLTEEQKAANKAAKAPERATLAQIVRSVQKLAGELKDALTPVDESKFDTDEAVEDAKKDKQAARKYAIRELLKLEANPIVRGRPIHKRIKDLITSSGVTEQERADIKKGIELASKVNLKEERLSSSRDVSVFGRLLLGAKKLFLESLSDPAYYAFDNGTEAINYIIKTGNKVQRALASRLRNYVGDVKIVVVDDDEPVPAQLRTKRNAEAWERSRALYVENYTTGEKTIFLRGSTYEENSRGINTVTVLHELFHAATNQKIMLARSYIQRGVNHSSDLVKAYKRLVRTMKRANDQYNALGAARQLSPHLFSLARDGEIFQDSREFVAYGLTDEEMQDFLLGVEGETKKPLWNDFVNNLRNMFGIPANETNALSDLLLVTDSLLRATDPGGTQLGGTQVSAQAKRSAEEIDDAVRQAKEIVALSRAGEEARGVKLMQLARDPKKILDIFASMWAGAKNTQREVMVRMPTFDFLAKWMGKDVPMLNDMNKNLQLMMGMSTKFLEGAEQVTSALQRTFNAEPNQRKKVENLVLETTLARIDPSKPNAQERSPVFDADYRALTPAGKAAYVLLRTYYERVHDLYRLLLDDQINNLEGIGEEAKAKLMATIRLAYEGKESIKPFFPLVRRGNFWVSTGTGPNRQFFMFESRAERDDFAKQLSSVNANREVKIGNDVSTLRTASRDASKLLKELFEAVDNQELNEPDEERAAVIKEDLKDAIYQIYLHTMPEQSFRKMFVHRKGVAGFSTDLVRNTATTASKMATQLSRLKYAPILRNNLIAARSLLGDRPELTPVVNEAERRVELALSGQEGGFGEAIAGLANKASYLWYLSSASSALIQPFSLIISGIPVLGANHGNVTGAAVEIGRMMTFINQYGITRRNIDGTLSYVAPSLANNKKLPADERDAVRQMTERGVQDSTYSSLVWGYARTPSANLNGVVGRGKSAANLLIGGLMHHFERLSREALYLASYRLGKQRGLTSDEAIDQAVSDVNEALGNYDVTNRPRWMQTGLGKVAFQFKMYPLQMTLLALTSLKRMMPFLNKEGKREAATKFFGLMGTSLMLAGTSNMLFFSPIMGLLGWAWKQMDDDDDLPDDLKKKDFPTWFHTVFLPEKFGDISIGGIPIADIIARGPINAFTGADVGSRAGFHDLWGRDTKDMKTARESFIAFMLDTFGGPTASLVLSMIDAYEAYALGDYQKAIEKASPSVIRNIVIAHKYATEGVESSRGSVLVPKEALTKGELFGQAIGFRPDRVAAAQAAAFKLSGVEQRVMNERATLLKRLNIEHRNAEKSGNTDRFKALIADEITKFNRKNPENAITFDNIEDSILKKAELRASERAGVALTEKNARLMRDSLDNMQKLLERQNPEVRVEGKE